MLKHVIEQLYSKYPLPLTDCQVVIEENVFMQIIYFI